MTNPKQYPFLLNAFSSLKFVEQQDILALLQTLYALYHDITVIVDGNKLYFQVDGYSPLGQKLYLQQNVRYDIREIIKRVTDQIYSHKDSRLTEDEYHELVELLFEKLSHNTSAKAASSIYPKELSLLYRHIIQQYNCHNIYNPFAGMASIGAVLHGLDVKYKYTGQDFAPENALWSNIRLDACDMDYTYSVGNSISHFLRNDFDAIVAMQPFGMRIPRQEAARLNVSGSTCDDFYYSQALDACKNANLMIGCSSFSFCASVNSLDTRTKLCKARVIDTIIELPSILSHTSISPYIIIITPNQKHDSVRFIRAKSASTTTKQKKVLDLSAVIKMLDNQSDNVMHVPYEQIESTSCILSSEYYKIMPDDIDLEKKLVALGDLVSLGRLAADRFTEVPVNIVRPDDFSSNFYDICTKSVQLQSETIRQYSFYRKYSGQHIVLSSRGDIYWHKDDTEFAISNGIALKVRTNKILPEYLIYLLLNSKHIKDFFAATVTWTRTFRHHDSEYLLKFRLAIEPNLEKQKSFVDDIIDKENEERQKVLDSVRGRKNIVSAVGDIMHIISTPMKVQNKIISSLNRYKGDKNHNDYIKLVNSLSESTSYIQRLLNAMNSDYATESYTMESVMLDELVSKYIDKGFISYLVNCPIKLIMQEDVHVKADSTMIEVMLDCIMENADRHAFRSSNITDKQISITLEKVVYKDEPFSLLSIKNNGKPLPDGLTVRDYSSKGRFKGKSGRSGLGGYHVYAITKKHGGYIYLRSDEEWSFILDILLPLQNANTDNILNIYDYEAI